MNGHVENFSKNFISAQMARNAEQLATVRPKAKIDHASNGIRACQSTQISFIPARAIAGMPNKKEKRAASSRLKFRNNAAVSVEPERDTPGIKAPIWAMPTINASRKRISPTLRWCRQVSSEIAMRLAITMHEAPMTLRLLSGESHALSIDDKAMPTTPIGIVAKMMATARRNAGLFKSRWRIAVVFLSSPSGHRAKNS